MAKIKHTKNELKAQTEALTRYERFLPMLQLKKQQLQLEIRRIDKELRDNTEQHETLNAELEPWVELFSEPVDLDAYLEVAETKVGASNIAGVAIPVFEEVVFKRTDPDILNTPAWLDDGLDMLEQLVRIAAKRRILEEQRRLIGEELRITTQRVNLFEKVKIPECRENIRVIKIFLGDQQTAAVARAKLAKSRTMAYEYAEGQGEGAEGAGSDLNY